MDMELLLVVHQVVLVYVQEIMIHQRIVLFVHLLPNIQEVTDICHGLDIVEKDAINNHIVQNHLIEILQIQPVQMALAFV